MTEIPKTTTTKKLQFYKQLTSEKSCLVLAASTSPSVTTSSSVSTPAATG